MYDHVLGAVEGKSDSLPIDLGLDVERFRSYFHPINRPIIQCQRDVDRSTKIKVRNRGVVRDSAATGGVGLDHANLEGLNRVVVGMSC